ncbi:MAG TPA: periplasmic heavy metal sensor [Candidatus Binatia bacterium]|nr:periplasmic heavy metal sensor [Candidatus Binatia bacterium]
MSRRTKIGVTVAVAVVLLAGATAFAVSAHGGRPAIMKRVATAVIDDALDAATVTQGQRATIYAARDRVFAAVEEARKNRGARIEEVLALFEADSIDPAQADALRTLREQQHQQVADVIQQAVIEVHDVLSPAQRKALADYVRARHARHLGG